MKMHILLAAVAAAALLHGGGARAQETEHPTGSATFGAALFPEYQGSEDFQTLPLINGRLEWGDRYVELNGVTLRANVLPSPRGELGPVVSYRFGRGDDVSNAAVEALPEIDAAIEVGAFAAYTLPAGVGALRLSADIQQDVTDTHDGWIATAAVGYGRQFGERWSIGTALNASVVSDDYASTYFSVSQEAAAASGLAAYDADGGLLEIGVDLSVSYALSERSSIDGFIGYSRLVGDFADSPIVTSGDADEVTLAIGFTRKF